MIVIKQLLLLILLLHGTKIAESKVSLLQSFNLSLVLEGLRNVNSSTCKIHINEYLGGLTSGKSWAQTMHDSSAYTLHGVFMGNNKFLGHYDECLSVNHPENLFKGQHCLLKIDIYDEENGSEIFQVTQFNVFRSSYYYSAFFAICIPSTCDSREIEEALEHFFNKTEDPGSILVRLNDHNCYTEKNVSSKNIGAIVLYFLIILVILNLCSTIYDIVQRFYYRREPQNFLVAFSVFTNSSRIFSNPPSELKVLNGIRGLFSTLVVISHAYLWHWQGPAENMRHMKKDSDELGFANVFLLVDLFFFMSGFLTVYLVLRKVAYFGYYDFPHFIANRYMRLTPLLVFMRWFNGWLFLNLGSGPLWNQINKEDFDSCKEGWTNALLYNWNYRDPMQKCMIHGWSLNVDMQLYFLSPLILIPILRYPSWAYVSLLSHISVATVISFVVSYTHGIQPQMKHGFTRWAVEYILAHTRASPWLIGILFGYFLHRIRDRKAVIRLSTFQKLMGWTVSLICISSTLLGNYFLPNDDSRLIGALCIAFQKVIWVLGWAWVIFACEEGFGGVISAFFSFRIFQLLAKLSYSIYIVHISVISYIVGIKRTNYTSGLFEMINFIPTIWILTLVVAILLTILVEIPVNNICIYILKDVKIFPIRIPAKVEVKKNKSE